MPRLGASRQGYGILQPRISVTFASAAGLMFARLYSGTHRCLIDTPPQSPIPTRTSSARGSSPARAWTTSTPFRRRAGGSGPGERAALARPIRRAARARRARLGCRIGRRVPFQRLQPRPPPAPLDPWRLADPVLAVSIRPNAPRRQDATWLPLLSPMEDLDNLRRSLVSPGRCSPCSSPAGRVLDGALPGSWTGRRPRGPRLTGCCRSPALAGGIATAQRAQSTWRSSAKPRPRCADRAARRLRSARTFAGIHAC